MNVSYNEQTQVIVFKTADLLDDINRKMEAGHGTVLATVLDNLYDNIVESCGDEMHIAHISDKDAYSDVYTLYHSYPEWDNPEPQDDPTAFNILAWLIFHNGYEDHYISLVNLELEPYTAEEINDLLLSFAENDLG